MEKLYTQEEYQVKSDEANKKGLFLYQLVSEKEYIEEVLEWEKKIIEIEIIDPETGEPTGKTQQQEVNDYDRPIMIEEEIINPETGSKEVVVVQKHHSELKTKKVANLIIADKDYYICFEKNYTYGEINPNYEAEQIEAKREQFNKDFFLTSLGFIRRKVTMKTGETKDFLSDLLPVISMGVQSGQAVTIIAYKEPDFTTDVVDWESLQEVKTVTAEFVQECFARLSSDFTG